MDLPPPPTQPGSLFVSYSRKDMDPFYLVKRSKLGGLIWYDARDIKVGDPSWRRKIEAEIKGCCGMLVLCSPSSKESDAVATEIELAQAHKKPIFPVWVDGEVWGNSAPFSIVPYNAVDFRHKDAGGRIELDRLAEMVLASWPARFVKKDGELQGQIAQQYYKVDFENLKLFIKIENDDRFVDFLHSIYEELLKERVAPFSYGSQWCLRREAFFYLPAAWPTSSAP